MSGQPDPPTSIRVLIADDQRVLREGLTLLVSLLEGVEVVGAVADGEQVLAAAVELVPDVVLLDLRMPKLDGLEALRRLRGLLPGVEVVVLTTYADDASVLGALREGARGYLTKDATAAEIDHAIREAVRGRTQLGAEVQARLVELATAGPPVVGELSEREREVLGLIAEGLANKAIARRLVISEATVKTHVNNIFTKLGVTDRAAAVAFAYRSGRRADAREALGREVSGEGPPSRGAQGPGAGGRGSGGCGPAGTR